jgi:hypothetical protein
LFQQFKCIEPCTLDDQYGQSVLFNIIVVVGLSLTLVKSGQKLAIAFLEWMQTAVIVIAIILLIEWFAILVCFCS